MFYAPKSCTITLLLAAVCSASWAATPLPVVMAVLEHPQCAANQSRIVRPIFERISGTWKAAYYATAGKQAPTFWRVLTTGAPVVAPIQSEPPDLLPAPEWTYYRDYFHRVAPSAELPSAPNSKQQFGGWCEPPTNRPTLLIADAATTLPKLLAPHKNAHIPASLLLSAFRKSYGLTKLCVEYNDQKPVQLGTNDIKVVEQHRFKNASLIAATLTRALTECHSEIGGTDLPRWFVVQGDRIKHIGDSLNFVGAVNFDQPEHVQYIFWYSGYNRDGYVMFNDRFDPPVRFVWNYH